MCVALALTGACSRVLNYTYVLIPLPVATTKGFPAFPLPKWGDAHTHFLTSSVSLSLSLHPTLEQDSVELAPAVNLVVTLEIKVQGAVLILTGRASVTKQSPVQIIRQSLSGGNEWLMLCPPFTATEMPLREAFNPLHQWSCSFASGYGVHMYWAAPSWKYLEIFS